MGQMLEFLNKNLSSHHKNASIIITNSLEPNEREKIVEVIKENQMEIMKLKNTITI